VIVGFPKKRGKTGILLIKTTSKKRTTELIFISTSKKAPKIKNIVFYFVQDFFQPFGKNTFFILKFFSLIVSWEFLWESFLGQTIKNPTTFFFYRLPFTRPKPFTKY